MFDEFYFGFTGKEHIESIHLGRSSGTPHVD
jgi:hypothetical protein